MLVLGAAVPAGPDVRVVHFCRVHQTLRMTPAMEAGWADHIWDIKDYYDRGRSQNMCRNGTVS